jgi:radical SAM superfamily enzyme YgiQ (UPF0313 family)
LRFSGVRNWIILSALKHSADIVLSTLNAKYIHAAFGLRYLLANLGDLQDRACLVEFDLQQRANDIAEVLLARKPKIIGLGVYIWNAQLSTEVVQVLKRVAPDVILILGGPEVSYETEQQSICQAADYVITGEADLKFAEVCRAILSGAPPNRKIISAELPELEKLALPYDLYDDNDIANRIIYVEASRGCPFTCEFCLSSLDIPVRAFAIDPFLAALERLLDRGVKHFKFVDRTFNLNLNTSRAILEFFLARYRPGHFFHFEMIPDRLPEGLREVIAKFPPGALQFEVGIQTFNPEVSARIKRRQNYDKLAENFRFLRGQTGVHIHADLIVGLPGEDVASFARGFDQIVALGPQEIQVGILKRLRGTPIVRHDDEWQMKYNPHPPYELLANRTLSFDEMQTMRRFSRHWDLLVNSGNFVQSAPLIWSRNPVNGTVVRSTATQAAPVEEPASRSPFWSFLHFSDWLYAQMGRNHAIALGLLAELLFRYLTEVLGLEARSTANTIYDDYERGGRSDKPALLRPYLEAREPRRSPLSEVAPKRQARHLIAPVAR